MENILIGGGADGQLNFAVKQMNRHGLVSGATGTGKTATLKVIAENLSDMGVPVFIPDVKGDLSGFMNEIEMNDIVNERINKIGIENYCPSSYSVRFFDVLQQNGHPIRTTVSELGPMLFAQLLSLNDTQEGILRIAFQYADDNGLLLLDLKDLKSVLNYISDNASELRNDYGNISSASVGAVMRSLLALEQEGGDIFLGEPAFDINDLFTLDADKKGIINILDSSKLILRPRLYCTFMLWLLSELYENLDEAGDLPKPKLVFFFDEAHLLFDNANKVLLEKLQQIIKLIRSKGVGIFFVTQNPSDIDEEILAQLGNRICHSMRAYTPKERKSLKSIAEGFVQNPEFDTEEALTALKTGEALVSGLLPDGAPDMVHRVLICSPRSNFKPAALQQITASINQSPLYQKYTDAFDRESAYEILQKKAEIEAKEAQKEADRKEELREKAKRKTTTTGRKKKSTTEKLGNAVLSSFGRSIGNSIARGLLGSMKRKLF